MKKAYCMMNGMKILCIGDSNTYGYDPHSYIGSRYPEDIRWTDRVMASWNNENPDNEWNMINLGVNGMTAARARSAFEGFIKREAPDLVIVMLGTNDILSGYDPEEIADRIDDLVGLIVEAVDKVVLIAPPLLRPGDWVTGEGLIEESRTLGDLYREISLRNNCLFANAGEWDIEITFDGVHFSPEGHALFAEKIRPLIEQLQI
jgi:lysophospholipase L1-like esterase